MTATNLLIERRGAVALLTLNRPESLNAIDAPLREQLTIALRGIAGDAAVQALVLTGAGQRAFCAGQDLAETARFGIDDVEAWLTAAHAMYRALIDLDKPTIAAFNGVAAGAGFQLGLCCDLRVGFPEIRIGQPEVRAGLASIVGTQFMSFFLGRGPLAELSLTGELIPGERAHQLGLINRLVPRERVLDVAFALAEELARLPSTAVKLTKQWLRASIRPAFESALQAAIAAQKQAYASGEPQAAMRQFLDRRRDGS